MKQENALAVIETMTAVQLFTAGAIDRILERIKEQAREEASNLDVITEANRKAIASLAYKVARSKTFIDTQRKKLVEDEKTRLRAIDKEGARIWDELEALQIEVRKPLTDFEQAEKDRIVKGEGEVAHIVELGVVAYGATTSDIESALSIVTSIDPATFGDFAKRVAGAQASAASNLRTQLTLSKVADADRAEIDRLRAESAERAQRERDEAIAKAARDEAQRMAGIERKLIEDEKFQAEARAKQAEAQRIESEKKAARDAKEAEERMAAEKARAEAARIAAAKQAEADRLAAIESERKRVADAKRKEDAEMAAREKDKAHRAEVNSNALAALVAAGLTHESSKTAVQAIAKGLIPNIKISY